MTWPATIPMFTAGEVVPATDLTALADAVTAIGSALTTYTPTLVNWTLGNGALAGRYSATGKWVRGYVNLNIGSTTSMSGTLGFTLPADSRNATNFYPLLGWAYLLDTSATDRRYVTPIRVAPSVVGAADAAGNLVTPTSPWTWAVGDLIHIAFEYESA